MKYRVIIKVISCIELLIGLATFVGLIIYSLLCLSKKPLNVFMFVLISSLISILIGFGLLNYQEWARKLLLFFSLYIVLTKVFIFSNLLQFTGEIITFIPASFKNIISILYHSLIAILFSRKAIKRYFKKPTHIFQTK